MDGTQQGTPEKPIDRNVSREDAPGVSFWSGETLYRGVGTDFWEVGSRNEGR